MKMKVLRLEPTERYPRGEVVEVFPPDFCAAAGWTETSNASGCVAMPDDDPADMGWVMNPDGEIVPSEDYLPTLEEAKADKLAAIAEARWADETGGIVYAGRIVYTDRDSQAKLTGAIVAMQATGVLPGAWKCADGWLPVASSDELLGLAMAVQGHVQACYATEARLQEAVAAAETVEEVRAVMWNQNQEVN